MKKILLLIIHVILSYATYSAAIAGVHNPPPATTFPTTITGPSGTVNTAPITVTLTLGEPITSSLTSSSSVFVLTNATISALSEKLSLSPVSQFGNPLTSPPPTAGLSTPGFFNNPNGIAVDGSGQIYVTDQLNGRVEIFNPTGSLIRTFGTTGSGNNQLNNPNGIALDANGNIYVADTDNDRVMEFSNTGDFIQQIGAPGTADDRLSSPQGIYVDASSNNVFIADADNNRIKIFKITGSTNSFVTSIGTSGSGDGQLNAPMGVVTDATGNIYVADSGNNRIVIFKAAGGYGSIGGIGRENGQFEVPAGLAIDATGKIYVADNNNHRVQVFTTGGALLGSLGASASFPIPGTGSGQFYFPTGVAVDKSGNVYVADQSNQRIQTLKAKDVYTITLAPTTNGTVKVELPESAVHGADGEVNADALFQVEYLASPSIPGTLVATSLDKKIKLDWPANPVDDNILIYTIYGGESPDIDAMAFVSSTPGTTYKTPDFSFLTNGTTYYYYITATNSIGTSAASNIVSVTPKGNQTITVNGSIPNKTYGDAPFTLASVPLTATASSGLPVTYSVTGPATISGTTITITGAGHVVLAVNQAGGSDVNPAPEVDVPFEVNKAGQTITVAGTIPNKIYGDAPFDIAAIPVTATASSGLAVAYSILSGPATISGTTITLSPGFSGPVVVAFNQAGNDNYNAAPQQTLSFNVDKADQTITVAGTIPDKIVIDAPFDISAIPVTATASSNLPVAITIKSGDATISGTTITLLPGASGPVVVAFNQAGNDNYNAAPEQTLTFNVSKLDQTITVAGTIPDKNPGDAPFDISAIPVTATASSTLPVAITIKSGDATISGTTIALLPGASGPVVVAFNQAGNDTYNPAPEQTLTFNVGKLNQTITVAGTIPDKNPGDAPFDISAIPVTATASSNLPVAVTIKSGNATIIGTTITLTGAGPVVVAFNQAGNDTYNPAPEQTLTFNVGKLNQTITVAGTIPDKNPGDAPFDISAIPVTATASSGLPVAITIKSGNATIIGTTITLTGAGPVVVAFNQAGNDTYNPAPEQTLTFNVGKLNQTITVAGTIPDKNPGDAPFDISAIPVTATASSNLPVAITIKSGDATISGTTITLLPGASGPVVVAFNQAGNDNYNAAPEQTLTFNVSKLNQTITVAGTIPDKNPGDAPFDISAIPVTATASSGLPVAITIKSGNATISGTTITLTGAGTVVVAFNQAGNDTYNPAPEQTLTFNVGKLNQTITVAGTIPDKNPGDAPFDISAIPVTATASSGLPVAITIKSGNATISGTTITLTGAGTVVVAFNQAGNSTYNPAPEQTLTFNVGKLNQTITVAGTIPDKNPGDAPFDISAIPVTATASSNLPVAVTIKSGNATISGTTITLTGAGTVVVAFNQAGNSTYNPAPEQTLTFNVGKLNQTITVAGTIPDKNPGDAPFDISAIPVTATASSNLPVAVTIKSGNATISGTTITLTGAGTVVVAFNQAGNDTYNPAPEQTLTFNVGKLNQTITVAGTIPDKNPGDAPFDISAIPVTATASSGLPVAITIKSGNATISGTTITLTGAGTVVVAFNQAGNSTYNPAPEQTLTFNVHAIIPQITWANPADITYGTALSNIQLNASVSGVTGTLVYAPTAGTILNVGNGQPLKVTFTPTGADAANYSEASKTVLINVKQATPVIVWDNPAAVPVGTVLGAAQLNAQAAIAGTFTYTPAAGTVLNTAGNQTLSVVFHPADSHTYADVNKSVTIYVYTVDLTKINPQINWATPADITYGTALSSTQLNATATLPGSATAVAGTFAYSPAAGALLSVGSHTLSVSFTPSDPTLYNPVTQTVTINVNPVSPVVTWANPAAVPVGTVLGAAQLNAQATIAGTFTYSPAAGTVLNTAGDQTLSVVFHPADPNNYADVNKSVTIHVYTVDLTKTTPVINWATPADITYGTALSPTQLNASTADASIHGTFVYSPGAGALLSVGSHILSVSFTPDDQAHYNNATKTVTINVNPVSPVVTWANPAAITYGTALSATQLNASANVAGTFTYSPGLGTILNAGNNQTLLATFTPADRNYPVTGKTVIINVNKASPVITWAKPADIAQGVALSATQLNATADVPGTFVYTPAIGAVLNIGANQTLSVTFTPADAGNYNAVTKTVQISVTADKLTPVITWTNPTSITYGTPLSDLQLYASSTVPGTFTYSPAAGTVLHAGTQSLSVTFTPTDAAKYNTVTKNVSIAVNKATLNISVDNASRPYNQPNPDFVINYSGFVNGDTKDNLTTQASASTTATVSSLVGAYPITVGGAVSDDYTFRYINATLTINAVGRDLTFNQLPVKTYGDPDFDAGATSTSGEPIIYTSSNTAVATVINGRIHIVGAGYVTITASLPVNPDYNTTPSVSQFMIVNKAAQLIDFANIPVQIRGTTYDLSNVKSSSGLPVTFTSNDPMIASIDGLTVSSLRIGITGIVANQAGDANYYPANSVVRNIEVKDVNHEVIVHPAVSPNGDGINDILYIEGITEHPANRVTIINRNGVRVYEINGYDNSNKYFDGRSNFTGAKQQAGTYFYLVEYAVDGVGRHLTGYFVLKYE